MLLGWKVSNVAIEDLTIDGAELNAGYGLAVFGMGTSFSDVAVRRVKACNVGGSAIAVAGGRQVIVEQCVGCGAKIGFEMGSPSEDYQVLHCTAYGCTNGALIFNPADQYNEAGNLRPRVIGGCYAGEGRATPVAMWDCWEALVAGVSATQGVTTNIQISSSHRGSITTPVGGGLIEGCLAEGSIGSAAGRWHRRFPGRRARLACSLIGNEECGVAAGPGEGGQVAVLGCMFRPGPRNVQRYAIVGYGTGVSLVAQGNLWRRSDAIAGAPIGFLGNPALRRRPLLPDRECRVQPGRLAECAGRTRFGRVHRQLPPLSGRSQRVWRRAARCAQARHSRPGGHGWARVRLYGAIGAWRGAGSGVSAIPSGPGSACRATPQRMPAQWSRMAHSACKRVACSIE